MLKEAHEEQRTEYWFRAIADAVSMEKYVYKRNRNLSGDVRSSYGIHESVQLSMNVLCKKRYVF